MVMKRVIPAALAGLILGFFLAASVHSVYKQKQKAEEEARLKAALHEVEERLNECRITVADLQSAYTKTQKEKLARYSDPAVQAELVHTRDLPLLAIGDSVMLGAKHCLEQRFPDAHVDARENRSFWPAYYIIEDAKEADTEFNPVVIGIGTNSPLDLSVCRRIIELCDERQVFWITTTNNWQFYNTDKIFQLGEEFDNVTVIDWDTYSDEHEEYFYSDSIHLTEAGRNAYADLVYASVTERLFSLLPQEEHRLYLIGDGYLLSCMNDLRLPEEETYVLAEDELSASLLEKRTGLLRDEGILPEEIILVFAKSRLLESDLGGRIAALFPDHDLNLAVINDTENDVPLSLPDPVTVYEYTPGREAFTLDKHHLTREGSEMFAAFLMDTFSSKE